MYVIYIMGQARINLTLSYVSYHKPHSSAVALSPGTCYMAIEKRHLE
jgi:hypothetical protein